MSSNPLPSRPVTGVDGIKSFYDDPRVVEDYLKKRIAQPFGSVLHELQVAFLKETLERPSILRVLDLASGPARLGAELEPRGLAVATDFSLHMLREARRRTMARGKRWQAVQGDGYELPFARESFDLVYSLRFIRRFDAPRRTALYAEIRRVLRFGGFFVMDAQNRDVALPHRTARGLDKYPVHDELFQRRELIVELERNGFEVIRLHGMMRRFGMQSRLNRLRHLRLSGLACLIIRALEHASDQNPSTWMVLCQKRGEYTPSTSPG